MWVGFALIFDGVVWVAFGADKAVQFATGYVLEEALSVDNVFVFSVILTFFAVPKILQHRVLFWGILGALVLRGVFIGTGSALLHMFHWVMYVFGAVLIYTGIKLLFHNDGDVDPSKNVLVRGAKAFLPFTDDYRGDRFFVREGGKWVGTPLFIVLLAIEGSDVLFAVDSIPAVFSVTRDPFIVYTSNIFAILGLRSLFFLVAGAMENFHFLKYGLSVILMFIGTKMLVEELVHVPTIASLGVIAVILTVSIGASVVRTRRSQGMTPTPD
jgi:tellurite resistance protein TerC